MLYVIIKPPAPTLHRIRAARAAYGLDDSYPADRLHCTMLRLGDEADWSAVQIDRLRYMLGNLAVEPFPVLFDLIAGSLLRAAKGMPGAAAFHRLLRGRAEACGVALPSHDFWLHLSLAYRGVAIAAARRIDPIGWTVEEFLLIRSDRGHDVLDRWPLRQRQLALAL